MKQPQLEVQYLPIESLTPYAGNARTHSASQVRQIENSMRAFGFMNPVLIDATNQLISGHGRYAAAKKIGLERIPAIRLEHLSEAERRAYSLADNRIALGASWDPTLLQVELEFLTSFEVNFDIELTGFSTGEVDELFVTIPEEVEDEPVDTPLPVGEAVSQPLDIWLVGTSRVACGDCRDPELIKTLMNGELAQMVFTDPPYNVKIKGNVGGLGKHHHPEFAMASGEMSSAEFIDFLKVSLGSAAGICVDGALVYCCMDWRHLPELYAAAAALDLSVINHCVWIKSNAGMGSLYRSQHEEVLVLKHGTAPHINNVELGKHGRYRTNCWEYSGMNTFGAERDQALAMHPTVKPVKLVVDAIKDVTGFGDLVFDGFLGSGTTLMSATSCKRRCYGVELEPHYVDVTLKRWMAVTKEQPIHLGTGMTFAQMEQTRLPKKAA